MALFDKTPVAMPVMVAAVRRFANANYDIAAWDVLVECWDDAQIIKTIGKAKNEGAAIKAVAKVLRVIHERRTDIMGA
jgi:hypothetical protein